ncbi:hypothetical protein JCM10207_004951 [Rhodosporidiobolus poonsookiae]
MQVDLPWELEGGRSEEGVLVVVDTNILISHLPLLRDLVQLVSTSTPAPPLTLLIPHIVLQELDGLKASSRSTDIPDPSVNGYRRRMQTSISSLARAATNWLLSAMSGTGHAVVRGQRKSETLVSASGAGRSGQDNDSLVLDAALFFQQQERGVRVVLLSDDNNLRLRATFEQVEAVGVGPKADAQILLAQFGTPPAHSPSSPPPALVPSPSRSPRVSPQPSSPTSTRKRRTPPRQLSFPLTCSTSPIPLPSTLAAADAALSSMELDPPTPPPLTAYIPPPLLVPVHDRADVFRNLRTLVAHLVALPVFRRAFEHLRRTRPAEQRVWQLEMGDWRLWEAEHCVERARAYWSDGDVEGMCRLGLEHASKAPAAAAPSPPPPPPKPQVRSPPRPSPSDRGTGSSRWATSSPSSTRPPPRPRTPSPPPPPPVALTPPSAAPISVDKRLMSLSRSLSNLSMTLSTSPHLAASWSAPRFEVLLEETALFLLAVLGGAVGGDVSGEIRSVVGGWEEDLRRVGVRVEVSL